MSTRIYVIYRIIIAVCVKVQTVYRLRINIRCIIRRDKSTPLGGIVARVEVVQPEFIVIVISTISDRIFRCYAVRVESNVAITPRIVSVSSDLRSARVVNADDAVRCRRSDTLKIVYALDVYTNCAVFFAFLSLFFIILLKSLKFTIKLSTQSPFLSI